jgi:hypothetical protein
VWGSLAHGQPKDHKQVVRRLLRLLDGVHGTGIISDVVLAEIKAAEPSDATQILDRLRETNHTVHPISPEIESLALAYAAAACCPNAVSQMLRT